MSWIIKDSSMYACGIDRLGFAELTSSRDNAKRLETKQDAKAFNEAYQLGGHVIPA